MREALIRIIDELQEIVDTDPLVDINMKLTQIIEGQMALSQKEQDLITRFDNATTQIAAEIADLKSKIGTGMSQADVDDLNAQLDAKISQLEALGATPEQPIPTELDTNTTTQSDTTTQSGSGNQ